MLMMWEERFRTELKRLRLEKGIDAANLSIKAGLNRRAVTDIEIGAAKSPKLTTAIALAEALNVSLAEMLGVQDTTALRQEWVEYLSRYDEEQQLELLDAVRSLRGETREG